MNRKKVIIGVLMAAIFVMVAFIPLANNIPTDKGNTGVNSISPQIAISKYVINKSPAAKGNINSNISNKIAISFSTWYIKNHAQDKLPPISSKTGSMLFREYLNQSIAGKAYIMRLTNIEKSSFNYSNRMAVNSVESILHTGHNVPSKIQTGNSTSYVINIRPDLPGGVTSDSGSWVMVSINYFVYHAPWWLGGWTYTYGEHDVINMLYGGSSAQKLYNSIEHDLTLAGIADILSGVLYTVFAEALTSAVPSAGASLLIAGIVAAVLLAGAGLSALILSNDYTKLYESTYANEPTGNKYIWNYLNIDYYYPNNPVTSVDSSIGLEGKLSNGNSMTIIPNIAFGYSFIVNPTAGLSWELLVSDYSEWAHAIANKIGTNNWGSN